MCASGLAPARNAIHTATGEGATVDEGIAHMNSMDDEYRDIGISMGSTWNSILSTTNGKAKPLNLPDYQDNNVYLQDRINKSIGTPGNVIAAVKPVEDVQDEFKDQIIKKDANKKDLWMAETPLPPMTVTPDTATTVLNGVAKDINAVNSQASDYSYRTA
jgi:hypothetical protein